VCIIMRVRVPVPVCMWWFHQNQARRESRVDSPGYINISGVAGRRSAVVECGVQVPWMREAVLFRLIFWYQSSRTAVSASHRLQSVTPIRNEALRKHTMLHTWRGRIQLLYNSALSTCVQIDR
jgi:hypothetical protein